LFLIKGSELIPPFGGNPQGTSGPKNHTRSTKKKERKEAQKTNTFLAPITPR
jgi:hypothetical protein